VGSVKIAGIAEIAVAGEENMNREEAIKLIVDSKMPDIVMALAGQESSKVIGERLGIRTPVVSSLAPFFGIDRTQVFKAAKKKALKQSVKPSEAVNQVSVNFDISVDTAASIVKWAMDDFFKNKKVEESKESREVTEQIRQGYDSLLRQGYNKSQAMRKLSDSYRYDVETIRRKLKGFIPKNNYKGGRKPKLEEPTT
jgi:4-alpha-glucanotransferase